MSSAHWTLWASWWRSTVCVCTLYRECVVPHERATFSKYSSISYFKIQKCVTYLLCLLWHWHLCYQTLTEYDYPSLHLCISSLVMHLKLEKENDHFITLILLPGWNNPGWGVRDGQKPMVWWALAVRKQQHSVIHLVIHKISKITIWT